ncbi:MAG: hypothetical protein JRI68_34980, partial [Deltaproteobacteria bacterium]|nr:hypothetical protein [Deltaproteobacteria bacterium]
MSTDPFRGTTRVSAPVTYSQLSNRGCYIGIPIGLAFGGGFVGLGYALDWIDWTYGGTVIGGGCFIALITALVVGVLVAKNAKPKQGMLSVEGTRMSGPDEDSALDFNAAHDIEVGASDHEADLVIRVAGAGT